MGSRANKRKQKHKQSYVMIHTDALTLTTESVRLFAWLGATMSTVQTWREESEGEQV